MLPGEGVLNVVGDEPSPQSTSTAHGLSEPGSVNEPSAKEWLGPSSEDWAAAAVTTGATFAIATICTDSLSVVLAPSLSVTLTLTSACAGPSGNRHWKLPPVAVTDSDPATSSPFDPAESQSG